MIKESEITRDYLRGVFDVALGMAFPYIDPDNQPTNRSDYYAREILRNTADYPTAPPAISVVAHEWFNEKAHLMSDEEFQINRDRIDFAHKRKK